MKKYILKYTIALILILGMGMVSCDDRDNEITELDLDRVLTPYNLKASITSATELSLEWKVRNGADGYIIEIYSDSLEFKEENFVHMDEVSANSFKFKDLLGNTQFSARVKSVSVERGDSRWVVVDFKTGFKSVFLPFEKGDITATSIKFRWPGGIKATDIALTSSDGEVRRPLTETEIASGVVEFSDLTAGIRYTAKLYSQEVLIGETNTTTRPEGTIDVNPSQDLKAILEGAKAGDIFALAQGTYLADGTIVSISNSVTIIGERGAEATIHGQFEVQPSAAIAFKDVILDGKGTLDYAVKFPDISSGEFGDIVFENSVVTNYKKALVAGDKTVATIASIRIINSIVSNILTDGSEAIDIRVGHVGEVEIRNSTFNNVAPGRCFMRLDDSSTNFAGKSTIVTVEDCTFYKVTNSDTLKGLFYVRFKNNTLTIKRNIFSNTKGVLSGDTKTSQPDCDKNNYFEAPNFKQETNTSTAARVYDLSATSTTIDPQYEDAASGNFKTILTGVGDPRWY